MGVEFERWLEEELKRGVRSASGPPPVPRYATLPHATGGWHLTHAIAATAKSKVAVAATAVALAAGGTVGAKAAVTGNANPFQWGQQVKQKVVTCKQSLKPGEHGIGKCVSEFAKLHGQQQRNAHGKGGSHGPQRPQGSTRTPPGHTRTPERPNPSNVPPSHPHGPPSP